MLSRREQDERSPQSHSVRDAQLMGRRTFLQGAVIAGGLALAGCTPQPNPRLAITPSPFPENTSFPEGAEVPGARERLIKEVHALPESFIKKALIERALPYYEQQPPFVLNRSGLELTVYAANIRHTKTRKIQGDGRFMYQGSRDIPKEVPHSLESGKFMIPIPYLITDQEALSAPKENVSPGRTALLEMDVSSGDTVVGGGYPEITITTPHFELLNASDKAFYANFESLAFIKEAATLLFTDILLEEMYKKAKELNLPTTVKTITFKGDIIDTQIFSAYYAALFDNDNQDRVGRVRAVTDLAGYLIAMKADPRFLPELSNDSRYRAALQMLPTVDLGTTTQSIYQKSFEYVLAGNELQQLPHEGKIAQIP